MRQTGGMTDSPLKEQLRRDLTAAMKDRDELAAASLRMALTAITNEEVAGKQAKSLTNDDVVGVLSREVKKRDEAAAAFREGGREESAVREEAEAGFLRRYLPTPLTESEIADLVTAAVAEVAGRGQTGGRAMGAVMGVLKPQIAGRADGAQVAAAVKQALGLA